MLLRFLPPLICCLLAFGPVEANPIVKTELGEVNGFEFETRNGQKAEVFLNIPFAQPPVGELRFEKPQEVKPWEKPINGTKFGFDCVTHVPQAAIFPVSEDCLTLNVIRPAKPAPAGGFPVLVWVHGGGFEIGSASIYGYKGFAERYATRDIIVVSIQYRLAFMGFFSTGDSQMPGNLGMWDQAMAIKFIHSHIPSFGGDPSRITVWGLSAGGAAVGQLAISPHTRDFVYGSIEMSGSPWVSWAVGSKVPKYSKGLAQELGCTENIKACLKTKSYQEIHKAVDAVGMTTDNLCIIKWGPVIDGEFLPKEPSELIKEVGEKPAMIGVSDKDAAFFTVMGLSPYIHKLAIKKEDYLKFGKSDLKRYIERILLREDYGSARDAAIDAVLEYYSRNSEEQPEGFWLNRYSEMISDAMFNVAAVREIKQRAQLGHKIYAYSFEQYNEAIWEKYGVPEVVKGSVHVNEFSYMFDFKVLGQFEMEGPDAVAMNTIQEAIVTFAKTGVPSIPEGKWEEAGTYSDVKYLKLDGKPTMATGYYNESTAFWDSARSFGFDLVSMTSSKSSKEEL